MALVSKQVPFGGGGGHWSVQICVASEHGCAGSQVWSVHCLVLVSKHFCCAPGGGHTRRHVCPSAQGCADEQV